MEQGGNIGMSVKSLGRRWAKVLLWLQALALFPGALLGPTAGRREVTGGLPAWCSSARAPACNIPRRVMNSEQERGNLCSGSHLGPK